jgi:hypothetical protein
MVRENYILFLRPSFPGTVKHFHNDVEQVPEFGTEPRQVQAPNQILPISVKDTAQTFDLCACQMA